MKGKHRIIDRAAIHIISALAETSFGRKTNTVKNYADIKRCYPFGVNEAACGF